METGKDHIHYMLEIIPNTNLADLVKTIKLPSLLKSSD